jgi:uncharacterized protein (TIGR02118 family)
MAVKLTIVYENPTDPEAFERHYHEVHRPLARKIPNVRRVELAKVISAQDGGPAPAYRISEIYFDDYATARAALATPEGEATTKDALELATGGVRFLLSDIL